MRSDTEPGRGIRHGRCAGQAGTALVDDEHAREALGDRRVGGDGVKDAAKVALAVEGAEHGAQPDRGPVGVFGEPGALQEGGGLVAGGQLERQQAMLPEIGSWAGQADGDGAASLEHAFIGQSNGVAEPAMHPDGARPLDADAQGEGFKPRVTPPQSFEKSVEIGIEAQHGVGMYRQAIQPGFNAPAAAVRPCRKRLPVKVADIVGPVRDHALQQKATVR